MNHKIVHLGIAKLPKNVLSQFWIRKYFEFSLAVQLPFFGVDGNKDDLKGSIWGKHIQGSWKCSLEALTDIISPILNCIFAEAVILWVRHAELLERYQNPISMYVLLHGCCFLPRLLSLDFPSHFGISTEAWEIFLEQRHRRVRTPTPWGLTACRNNVQVQCPKPSASWFPFLSCFIFQYKITSYCALSS